MIVLVNAPESKTAVVKLKIAVRDVMSDRAIQESNL